VKIRIRGNSIRLRLTQSEVEEFNSKGMVQDSIQFNPSSADTLIYSLEKADCHELKAIYASDINHVKVYMPIESGTQWAESEQVGMENEIHLNGDKQLKILVEKDFQCLKARPGEDDDTFPNPDAPE